jgi:hypothetical protein
MLEIVKIELSDCLGCFTCDKKGGQLVSTRRCVSFKEATYTRRVRCRCKCIEAERNNNVLMEVLKSRLAASLHMGGE